MIMLGIDPGFRFAGFGIIKKENNRTFLLDHGYLKLPPKESIPVRTKLFYDFFKAKIIDFGVTKISLETPFLGKNPQNFLKLGYLRGILYLLSQQHNLEIDEFSPRQVKRSLTGFGGATKEQVAFIICRLFPKIPKPKKDDVTDALAVTLCGLWNINPAKQKTQLINHLQKRHT